MQLCPFAKRELDVGRVPFHHCTVDNEKDRLEALYDKLKLLQNNPDIETFLLIHPEVLQQFDGYNQFLDRVDDLIEHLKLGGRLSDRVSDEQSPSNDSCSAGFGEALRFGNQLGDEIRDLAR